MRVITGRHRPGLGMGMKLPFQHYTNDEDEEDNKNNSSEEEKHDNCGIEDEESSSGVYNVLCYLIAVSVSYHHPCLVYDKADSNIFY